MAHAPSPTDWLESRWTERKLDIMSESVTQIDNKPVGPYTLSCNMDTWVFIMYILHRWPRNLSGYNYWTEGKTSLFFFFRSNGGWLFLSRKLTALAFSLPTFLVAMVAKLPCQSPRNSCIVSSNSFVKLFCLVGEVNLLLKWGENANVSAVAEQCLYM